MLKKEILHPSSSKENKQPHMKKLFALCVMVGFIVIPCIKSDASVSSDVKKEYEKELEERVFEELQTGQITSEEDVIRVALQQYQERKKRSTRISGQEADIDESLSITQVLDHKEDENGDISENIMSTNLMVLDEDNNIMNARVMDAFNTDKYAEFGSYSIYATMTVSVSRDIGPEYNKVRFNCFDTTLYYGTAQKATSLVQFAWHSDDPYFTYDDIMKRIVEPQANVKYRYTPLNLNFISYGSLGQGRVCESVINVGSHLLGLRYSFTNSGQNDGYGTWEIMKQ